MSARSLPSCGDKRADMTRRMRTIWLIILFTLAGCGAFPSAPGLGGAPRVAAFSGTQASAKVSTTALAQPQPCTGAFVAHMLDFSTDVQGDAVHLFDSNGAGVAIGDLDDDGQLDLVFANLDGPNTIFWNQGGFHFRKQTLDDSGSRAVNLVDVDGDGQLDIVFTYRSGSVGSWRNLGDAHFARQALPGVLAPAYSMVWGDLNGDGALDLVTGSAESELAQPKCHAFLF